MTVGVWVCENVCVSVCVHNIGKSTDRPISWLKIAGTDPLLESQSSCCHMGVGLRAQQQGEGREGGQGCFRGVPGPWMGAQLFIPGSRQQQARVFSGLSCQSFLKQLCSEAYAGLTSEGNFLFGEVEAKEFPVWADRASWLEGFLEGKQFHNEMTN